MDLEKEKYLGVMANGELGLVPDASQGSQQGSNYPADCFRLRVDQEIGVVNKADPLKQDLQNRHMQMIGIGGAIGAGLFVGSGSSMYAGGPAPLLICYTIVGIVLLFTCQALAELAVLYPVNGAFYTYTVRFLDPAWGFALGWDYALTWLTLLPFELTAATLTIGFWPRGAEIHSSLWITLFLVMLSGIQFFGVRGYGEVEFVLGFVKICACIGFIILGIIINVGAVGTQGYLGFKYWHDPGGFLHGFNGFAGVFVVASFAYGGTELVGLAAAESANPRKSIPRATKHVFWRIVIVYILNVFILSLIIPANYPRLEFASGANSKFSPFVLAIQDAGITVLPSVFNTVICLAVISVANSCAFGSTRTMQALGERGMGPRWMAYVDSKGRPLSCILIQFGFGLLAYIGESGNGKNVFNWLLALSGLSYFFVWGSICLTHIRFRYAWKAQGFTLDQIPYRSAVGVYGSWIGFGANVIFLVATFCSALYPSTGATRNVTYFFQQCICFIIVGALYLFWKIYKRDWRLYIPVHEMDLLTGARLRTLVDDEPEQKKTWKNLPFRILRAIF